MRRLLGLVVAALVVCAGCTGGSDAKAAPTSAPDTDLTLASLDLGWRTELEPGDPPARPGGFDAETYDRMVTTLSDWAEVTTLDTSVWHGAAPVDAVRKVLSGQAGDALRRQAKDAVSPRLAVANVFADDVTVIGKPEVTTAWQVSQADDEDGKPYVVLELQTRAAYEVRLGDDGPTRVIGVLRVHGLSAYDDTTDDFGVSGGWQEFGAGDCALALDDHLVPDADLDETTSDLRTFARVGNADDVEMPDLDVDEQVDADYLKRCRDGAV